MADFKKAAKGLSGMLGGGDSEKTVADTSDQISSKGSAAQAKMWSDLNQSLDQEKSNRASATEATAATAKAATDQGAASEAQTALAGREAAGRAMQSAMAARQQHGTPDPHAGAGGAQSGLAGELEKAQATGMARNTMAGAPSVAMGPGGQAVVNQAPVQSMEQQQADMAQLQYLASMGVSPQVLQATGGGGQANPAMMQQLNAVPVVQGAVPVAAGQPRGVDPRLAPYMAANAAEPYPGYGAGIPLMTGQR